MSLDSMRSPELLNRASSRLLIVDVQEKLVATLAEATRAQLVESCRFLGEAARLMEIPISITEQYPQGLGPTVAPLAEFASDRPPKKCFSGVECLGWPTAAEATDDRFQIVVAGMETHVCILQTVLNLLAQGYQVSVVADAVASRRPVDYTIALQRLANSGAVVTTAEAVVFEWAETADAKEFKQLSTLVKTRSL